MTLSTLIYLTELVQCATVACASIFFIILVSFIVWFANGADHIYGMPRWVVPVLGLLFFWSFLGLIFIPSRSTLVASWLIPAIIEHKEDLINAPNLHEQIKKDLREWIETFNRSK